MGPAQVVDPDARQPCPIGAPVELRYEAGLLEVEDPLAVLDLQLVDVGYRSFKHGLRERDRPHALGCLRSENVFRILDHSKVLIDAQRHVLPIEVFRHDGQEFPFPDASVKKDVEGEQV